MDFLKGHQAGLYPCWAGLEKTVVRTVVSVGNRGLGDRGLGNSGLGNSDLGDSVVAGNLGVSVLCLAVVARRSLGVLVLRSLAMVVVEVPSRSVEGGVPNSRWKHSQYQAQSE